MILFLDFDGVLHPDHTYLIKRRPVLRCEGELLMWQSILEQTLAPYPAIKLVLSTSWVREFGYSKTKEYLSNNLQSRVIGATWHSKMRIQDDGSFLREGVWYDHAPRYQQIERYVERAGLKQWLAIDDRPEGWQAKDAEKLIQTNSETGLSDKRVIELLIEKLRSLK